VKCAAKYRFPANYCIADLAIKTSLKAKTYSCNVVNISFLFEFSIWKALFG
jgi:hypothetical protein